MNARIFLLLLLPLLGGLPAPSQAFPVPDGFGIYSSGSVKISGGGIHAVAVQPWDAKIIIGGNFSIIGGTPRITQQNLARINPDGTLDTAFNPPPLDGAVNAIALQPDPGAPAAPNFIVIGGSFGHAGGSTRNGLARVKSADGSLDSFNPATTGTTVRVNAIVLQPGATSVVVGGSFSEIIPEVPSPNLARLSVVSPDPGAPAWSYAGGINGEVDAILQLGDGMLLVAGNFSAPLPYLARFSPTGALDGGFAPPAPGGTVLSLAAQADGKILIGGSFTGGALARNYLARLQSAGTPDAGFVPNPNGVVASIVVRPDGKILVAGDFTQIGASAATRLARLSIAGALESALYPNLDAAVRVIAAQPDGKLLAGGDFSQAVNPLTTLLRPRTRLARFYAGGALDDDISAAGLALDGPVTTISLRPDGATTIGGAFDHVKEPPNAGNARLNLARFQEDWNLDATCDPALQTNSTPQSIAPFPDQNTIVGGWFSTVDGAPQKLVARLDPAGKPYAEAGTALFNGNINSSTMDSGAEAQVVNLLARDTRLPDGTPLADGMFYVAGDLTFGASPYEFVSRFTAAGLRDPSFNPNPPELDGQVWSAVIDPDNKLLVATETAVVRLKTNGDLDAAFAPLAYIYTIALQKDGQILVCGSDETPNPWKRNLVRIKSDGTPDAGFNIQTTFQNTSSSEIDFVTVQADGNILITGVFDQIRDSAGNTYPRDCVARLKPDGTLDTGFDLGAMTYRYGSPIGQVYNLNLQPDGKLLVGGDFKGFNGGTVQRLARFSTGWASESLSVAPDGDTATWLRGGGGPELWQAWFEYCQDPDAPTPVWTFLGNAQRVPGGWQLGSLNLAQFGKGVNRYLRASGYVDGGYGSGSLVQSVLLYNLASQTVISVTADPQGKSYGDPDPPLSYGFAPALALGDSFSGALARAPGEGVGVYAIGQGTLALNAGYLIAFTGANLSIAPKTVTVTANPVSKSYGAADPPLSYTVFPPLAAGDGFSGSLARAPGEGAGLYPIGQGTLSAGGNYLIVYVGADLSITPKIVSVTAEPQSKSYGDPDPPFSYSFAPALAPGDSFSGALSRDPGEGVGAYAIRHGSLSAGANYLIVYAGANLFILPRGITVTAQPAGKGYGDPDPPLGYGFAPALVGSDSFSGALQRVAGESVSGSPYVIQQGTLALSANYAISFLPASFSITRRAVTVTADPKGKGYGDADPPLSYGFAPALVAGDSFSGALSRAPGETVGSYPINQGNLALGGNYSIAYLPANLAVAPRGVTVTADPKGKSYGDPDPPLSYSFSPALVGSDSFSGALHRVAGESVTGGPYEIQQGTLALSANYALSYLPASFSITRRAVTVTADPEGKSYGDADPSLSYVCTPALVAGDSFSGALARAPGEGVSASPYAIRQGTLALSANYALGFVPANFSITRRAVTVTADPMGKGYGAADPPLTCSGAGLLPQDLGAGKIVLSAARAAGETPANYDIAPAASDTGTGLLSNYLVSYQHGSFTITKAPLTVTAEDKTRAYQTPNPQLTARYQGFVNGEDASALSGAPSLATSATELSPVGSYDIVASLGTLASPDYSFTLVKGTLNVISSCQEIVFPPPGDRTFGDPPFPIQAYACSGLGISFASSDPQVATISGTTLTITGAGSVVITASQQGNANLGGAPSVSQTLVVHRCWQGVTFPPLAGKVLGDPPFNLNATATSGLPVSYQSSDPSVARVNGSSVTIVGAGTCVITALQPGNGNYNAALPASQPLTVAEESAPPVLALSTLPSGAVTADPVLNVMGSASDLSGIASLTVNGVELAGQAALFSSAVALHAGANSIEVVVEDGEGNRTTQTLSVSFDAAAPEISLGAPADNSVTSSAGFSTSGRAAPGSSVSLGVNGAAPLSLPVGADGSFTGSGRFAAGLNTLEFSASLAGRTSRVKRSVTLAPGAPSAAILEPVEDLRTEQESITIRGAVGGGAAGVTLTVAGRDFHPDLQGGSFQQTITLDHEGVFAIALSAADAAGNGSVAQRNIIRVARILGDLNGDGCVDLRDALAALRISLGMDPATAQALAHGDVAPLVNGVSRPDGVIDSGDVLVILRKIVGLVDF